MSIEQALLTDRRRCRLWVVETASPIREQRRTKNLADMPLEY